MRLRCMRMRRSWVQQAVIMCLITGYAKVHAWLTGSWWVKIMLREDRVMWVGPVHRNLSVRWWHILDDGRTDWDNETWQTMAGTPRRRNVRVRGGL
mgnify:CR=1 FL=1